MKPDIRRIEAGTAVVLQDGKVVRVTHAGDQVLVNGKAAKIDLRDPRDQNVSGRAGAARGRRDIRAAMPGKVVRVLCHAGDSIAAGQGLLILEAMKMQNEMRAPGAGVVSAVKVTEGDTVAAGTVLVTLE